MGFGASLHSVSRSWRRQSVDIGCGLSSWNAGSPKNAARSWRSHRRGVCAAALPVPRPQPQPLRCMGVSVGVGVGVGMAVARPPHGDPCAATQADFASPWCRDAAVGCSVPASLTCLLSACYLRRPPCRSNTTTTTTTTSPANPPPASALGQIRWSSHRCWTTTTTIRWMASSPLTSTAPNKHCPPP